jgi:hypothetical protein
MFSLGTIKLGFRIAVLPRDTSEVIEKVYLFAESLQLNLIHEFNYLSETVYFGIKLRSGIGYSRFYLSSTREKMNLVASYAMRLSGHV